MHALKFTSAFCQEFEAWNASSFPGDKKQVSMDISRLGKTGNIFFKKKEVAESIFDEISIEKYKEIFFDKLKSFSLPFQDFINKHFHQGGELFSGMRYVNVLLLNSIGLQSTGTTREFVFEQEGNQLLVEEIFRVQGLLFHPFDGHTFSFDRALNSEVVFVLSEEEKAKLEFCKNQLKEVYSRGERVECSLTQENVATMRINIEDMSKTLFAEKFADDELALMTFRVRHRILLDASATEGVSRQAFNEDDFRATVHETLLSNSDTKDFGKLFSPKLTLSRWKFNHFKNVSFSEKCITLIIKGYGSFIFLIQAMLKYMNPTYTALSSKQAERFAEEVTFQSPFLQRKRA